MAQSVGALERVIRRKDMNRGQTTLLKYLYEADESAARDDDYVKRADLVADIRWGDDESFVGVLSAFSTRVNSTDGIAGTPGYEAFIERRDIDGEEHFRLRESARRAIDHVPELTTVFEEYTLPELLDNEGVPVEFEPPSIIDPEERDDVGWHPTTPENRLLVGYWHQVGGTIITEVETGASGPGTWPAGSRQRQLDGIRFQSQYRDAIYSQTAFSQTQLQEIVQDRHVEVIEVKQSLGRPVIGQAIAGQDMFQRDYGPGTTEPVVVCGQGDPALEWVCRRNGIRAELVEPETLD